MYLFQFLEGSCICISNQALALNRKYNKRIIRVSYSLVYIRNIRQGAWFHVSGTRQVLNFKTNCVINQTSDVKSQISCVKTEEPAGIGEIHKPSLYSNIKKCFFTHIKNTYILVACPTSNQVQNSDASV